MGSAVAIRGFQGGRSYVSPPPGISESLHVIAHVSLRCQSQPIGGHGWASDIPALALKLAALVGLAGDAGGLRQLAVVAIFLPGRRTSTWTTATRRLCSGRGAAPRRW